MIEIIKTDDGKEYCYIPSQEANLAMLFNNYAAVKLLNKCLNLEDPVKEYKDNDTSL